MIAIPIQRPLLALTWPIITSMARSATALYRSATALKIDCCCDDDGGPSFILLVQDYTFSSSSIGDVWITRYIDPDLHPFGPDVGSTNKDIGGRLAPSESRTQEMLVTRTGRSPENPTPPDGLTGLPDEVAFFVAITAESESGNPVTNRFDMDGFDFVRTNVGDGNALSDSVSNEAGSTGWNPDTNYDSTMALRCVENLTTPKRFVTKTIIGLGNIAPTDLGCIPGGFETACAEATPDPCGSRNGSSLILATGNVDIVPGTAELTPTSAGGYGLKESLSGSVGTTADPADDMWVNALGLGRNRTTFESAVAIGQPFSPAVWLTSGNIGGVAGGVTGPMTVVDKRQATSSFTVAGVINVSLTQTLICVP